MKNIRSIQEKTWEKSLAVTEGRWHKRILRNISSLLSTGWVHQFWAFQYTKNTGSLLQVQWRATKGLEHLSHAERQGELGLFSVEKKEFREIYHLVLIPGGSQTLFTDAQGQAKRQQAQTERQETSSDHRILLWKWSNTGRSCPQRLWNLHSRNKNSPNSSVFLGSAARVNFYSIRPCQNQTAIKLNRNAKLQIRCLIYVEVPWLSVYLRLFSTQPFSPYRSNFMRGIQTD